MQHQQLSPHLGANMPSTAVRQGIGLPVTEEPWLFNLPIDARPEPVLKRPADPVWTDNKAKLIERYLYYFVLVTRHSTYIDGFSGPQRPEKPSMWSAKLVASASVRT